MTYFTSQGLVLGRYGLLVAVGGLYNMKAGYQFNVTIK
jgi:hypothetical protein